MSRDTECLARERRPKGSSHVLLHSCQETDEMPENSYPEAFMPSLQEHAGLIGQAKSIPRYLDFLQRKKLWRKAEENKERAGERGKWHKLCGASSES